MREARGHREDYDVLSRDEAKDVAIMPRRSVDGGPLAKATAMVPATCGELVQGYLDGRDFLINSPIGWSSEVTVTLTSDAAVQVEAEWPFDKITRVVRMTLEALGTSHGARVELSKRVPRGKGLASSTSELAAAIAATARAFGTEIPPGEMVRLILEVDGSSDGVFLPGVTMCNHLTGELYASFGPPPPLSAVIVDTGGSVDTCSIDRQRARAIATAHGAKLRAAVAEVKAGFVAGDCRRIARGATLSAEINQLVLPKPLLAELSSGTREFGGLGVNCAHTGTVLGVLFDPTRTSTAWISRRVAAIVGETAILGTWRFIGGRVDVVSSQARSPSDRGYYGFG